MGFDVLAPANAERLRAAINSDPEFRLASRHASVNLCLGIGLDWNNKQILVQIFDGQVVRLDHVVDFARLAPDVALNGTEEFWKKFLSPVPPHPYQSVFAAMTIGQASLSGCMQRYTACYWPIARLVDLLRIVQNDLVQAENRIAVQEEGYTEPQRGRYVYVELEGVRYRVYYEENGQGIPLVCQHTVGTDGQQFRHVITDPAVTEKFRVIVLDLPYHGKSQPPAGVDWWAQEYRMREKWLIDFHVAFNRALGLQQAAYLGSSMGGNLALALALNVPDLYQAAIGVGAGLGRPNPRYSVAFTRHPDVNDQSIAIMNQALVAPTTSDANKWEVTWAYQQGAHGICGGDSLYFFAHDVRESAHLIDTQRCAVYVLNGEYDVGNGIRDGEEVVAKNPAIRFISMDKLGHFAMTEDYPAFRTYLLPVLSAIEARVRRGTGGG